MTPVAPDLYLYPQPGATAPGVDAEPQGAAALIAQATDDESHEDTLEQLALRALFAQFGPALINARPCC